MAIITKLKAREILDSRGFPTIEVQCECNDMITRAAVPSGASTGSKEAIELRDQDDRYMGKGVMGAIESVQNVIADQLLGKSVCDVKQLDRIMIECDGTENKAKLGANAILAVSLAASRAAAEHAEEPLYENLNHLFTETRASLPVPLMNILNGGAHADNNVDIQEFMIVPCGANDFGQSVRWGVEVYHALKAVLREKGLATAVGDEGGFAPDLRSNEEALSLIMLAIKKAGLRPGKDIYLALDVAASELYMDGEYHIAGKKLDSEQLIEVYANWVKEYPIISIEDGMDENDWLGWQAMQAKLGDKCQLVGDDIFVTNTMLLQKGIDEKAANAILIKLNQIGTLTETVEAIELARKAGFNVVISHRSGETEDPYIADLSVACGMGQIKTGAPCRSDRNAKYNQLLRISEIMGTFAGVTPFERWINQ